MPNKPVKWTHGKLNRWQVFYMTLCATIALGTGIVGYQTITVSQEVHKALCSSKSVTEDSLKGSKEFLEHPEKFPKFNEPAVIKLTKARVLTEEERLHYLKDVSC